MTDGLPATPIPLFCICCAAIVLPLALVALGTVTTARRQPISLEGSRVVDSVRVKTADGETIDAIRFGDAPWVAAASPEARRRFRNAPVTSTIAYRLDGRIVEGKVLNVTAAAGVIVRRLVLGFLALAFVVAGLALGMAGTNRAALHAGGFLAGIGATLAFEFLEPNLVLLASRTARDALIIAFAIVPAGLWCRYVLLLAADLPSALRIRRGERIVIDGVTAVAFTLAVLSAASQSGAIFDRLPFTGAILRLLESGVLRTAPYVVTAATTIVLIARQAKASRDTSREMRDRARIVAWGCGIGTFIPFAAVVVQGASLLTAHRVAIPRTAMTLLLVPLLLVPASLTYALLAKRVERAGILARRAVVFAIADRTLMVLCLAPLALLIAAFYRHRDESIDRFVAARLPLVVSLSLIAGAGLFFAAPMRRVLERLFLRDRTKGRRVLADLARRIRDCGDLGALTDLLSAAIDEALHVESVALYVRDGDRIVDTSNRETALNAVEQSRFRVLLPLRGSNGRTLGVLAIGETMSGVPLSHDDRVLLAGVAAAAALMLENFALRGVPAPPSRASDPESALICTACSSVFDPILSIRCTRDDAPLVAAGVPLVLHGKFRFEERLGQGAMGAVYRARDLTLAREVAIKTLPAVSDRAAELIEGEARAVAALSHPSIATIYAVETWHARPMLIFELLDRETLAARIARGPLAIADVIRIGTEVAAALAHAHAAGVIHRDVKPSNIGFSRDGAPKILDFGLARFRGEATNIAGTPAYLSPETVLGGAATPEADVWSLAVTLYEALTGRLPFAAANATLTMNAILSVTPADPRTLRDDVPRSLAGVLLHALTRERDARLHTITELREALLSCQA